MRRPLLHSLQTRSLGTPCRSDEHVWGEADQALTSWEAGTEGPARRRAREDPDSGDRPHPPVWTHPWRLPGALQLAPVRLALPRRRRAHVLCQGTEHTQLSIRTASQATESESERRSVASTSLRPHGLHGPWNSPGQNTGVSILSLLQGIFPTQGSNPGLPHCRRTLYQLSHKGGWRILEWVGYPFPRWITELGTAQRLPLSGSQAGAKVLLHSPLGAWLAGRGCFQVHTGASHCLAVAGLSLCLAAGWRPCLAPAISFLGGLPTHSVSHGSGHCAP